MGNREIQIELGWGWEWNSFSGFIVHAWINPMKMGIFSCMLGHIIGFTMCKIYVQLLQPDGHGHWMWLWYVLYEMIMHFHAMNWKKYKWKSFVLTFLWKKYIYFEMQNWRGFCTVNLTNSDVRLYHWVTQEMYDGYLNYSRGLAETWFVIDLLLSISCRLLPLSCV